MDLVTVGTYSTSAAAEMAKNFLIAEGLTAFVEEGAAGDMLHLSGEVKVKVPPEEAEQAQRLLADSEERASDVEE